MGQDAGGSKSHEKASKAVGEHADRWGRRWGERDARCPRVGCLILVRSATLARVYLLADEAGNFDFRRRAGATSYFVLCTIRLDESSVGGISARCLELRRELAWQGIALDSTFHATTDKQLVRDEVFRLIARESFRIDATILEKCKTVPHLQRDPDRFYKTAWHFHFKFVRPKIAGARDELLVVAASLGTKKKKRALRIGLEDVVWQSSRAPMCEVACWPAMSDPCLQLADYCTWAIQRKWESGGVDDRSYNLIAPKIATEYELFRNGAPHY
jgi:hypothetical protein